MNNRICAYCGLTIEKNISGYPADTHGMCNECKESEMKKLMTKEEISLRENLIRLATELGIKPIVDLNIGAIFKFDQNPDDYGYKYGRLEDGELIWRRWHHSRLPESAEKL